MTRPILPPSLADRAAELPDVGQCEGFIREIDDQLKALKAARETAVFRQAELQKAQPRRRK